MKQLKKFNWKYNLPEWISILSIIILFFIPTGFEDRLQYQGSDHTKAKVIAVNNDAIITQGVVQTGEQSCTVQILGGKFEGETSTAINFLEGALTTDKVFKEGDIARALVKHSGGKITLVNLIDIDRVPYELGYLILFSILLVVLAGRTGFRSLLSFVLSVLAIWKLLIPNILRGMPPIALGVAIISAITVLIILPIYGISYRALAGIAGSFLGILATGILGYIGTVLFRIKGTVLPRSESLLYNVSSDINLTHIFIMAIFIGASGAIMDLAVDITSSVSEVVAKKPSISWQEAFRSGMNVGRAAMGTMTTTLLLAYSGGYISLMMVFMAQGTPLMNILNYRDVASEILHTLVGSIGLVLVAPATAFAASTLLCKYGKQEIMQNEFEQYKEQGLIANDQAFNYNQFVKFLEDEARVQSELRDTEHVTYGSNADSSANSNADSNADSNKIEQK